ncbi:MAG: Lipase precursor [Labilithrix sp.]|nr:Lipase precursor [Labilithrix sp.]
MTIARNATWLCALPLMLALGCASPDASSDETTSDLSLGHAVLGNEPQGTATRYPLVLASGFATSPSFNNFTGVAEAFRADGHTVTVADLPPFDSTAVRGAALAKQIDAALAASGAHKVNIIAHSSGGTDAREVISKLGYGDRVASLTTISTAHQGTPLADHLLDAVGGVSDETLDTVAALVGKTFSDVAGDSRLRAGFASMAERNAAAFNAAHPDDARVYYQSWAGVAGLGGFIRAGDDDACEHKRFGGARESGVVHLALVPMALMLGDRPQDSLVPVASAKHGVFRGCIPADHLDEVAGGPFASKVNAVTGFDRVRFYRLLAFELAAKGF